MAAKEAKTVCDTVANAAETHTAMMKEISEAQVQMEQKSQGTCKDCLGAWIFFFVISVIMMYILCYVS